MPSDFLVGLLPDRLLLALIVALMLLELMRTGTALARAVFIGVLTAVLLTVLRQMMAGYTAQIVPGEVHVDALTLAGKLALAAAGLLLGLTFPRGASHKTWVLLSASLFGGFVILDSAGFASLFLGIELLSLPAFALIVHGSGVSVTAEGAFKYLLLSSVATALLLFGISLSYGVTGSLAIDSLATALLPGALQQKAALLLILAGLFMKAAVFPMHAWAPDAYAAAPLHVTALLASVVKAAVVLALARIVGAGVLDAQLVLAVAGLAIASIVFGNVAAWGQQRLRRLLAYSSIAHAGYMMFTLLDSTGARAFDLAWYAGLYAAMTILACASYAALAGRADDRLDALDAGFAARPGAALLLAFALLSLAGLPPFPGFFAKLLVFRSVVASDHLLPAVIAFAGSFLGLPVYLGIVLRLFRNDRAADAPTHRQAATSTVPHSTDLRPQPASLR